MKTKLQKQQMVAQISEKLSRAKSVIFTDYQGLTTNHLQTLRRALKEQGAEVTITKNTLLKIALKNSNYTELPQDVQAGPIATLFTYEDEIMPIKLLVKALKDAQLGKVKAGFLGKNFLEGSEIMILSALPSKLELQAKLVGVLSAPLAGLASVLQANLRNLVYAVDQIRKSKVVSN